MTLQHDRCADAHRQEDHAGGRNDDSERKPDRQGLSWCIFGVTGRQGDEDGKDRQNDNPPTSAKEPGQHVEGGEADQNEGACDVAPMAHLVFGDGVDEYGHAGEVEHADESRSPAPSSHRPERHGYAFAVFLTRVRVLSRMKRSMRSRASSSRICFGGDFIK